MNVCDCVYESVLVSAGCKCGICVSVWVYKCVCGCVCGICAYVCIGVHDRVCVLSRQRTSSALLNHPPPYSLERGSLTELGARLATNSPIFPN